MAEPANVVPLQPGQPLQGVVPKAKYTRHMALASIASILISSGLDELHHWLVQRGLDQWWAAFQAGLGAACHAANQLQ